MAQIYAPNRLLAGALPQTHWGSLHRSPDPLAGLGVGPTGNGKEGGRGKGGRGGEGKGREGRGGRPGMPKSRVGKPRFYTSIFCVFHYNMCLTVHCIVYLEIALGVRLLHN